MKKIVVSLIVTMLMVGLYCIYLGLFEQRDSSPRPLSVEREQQARQRPQEKRQSNETRNVVREVAPLPMERSVMAESYTLDFLVVDFETGRPISDVKLSLYQHNAVFTQGATFLQNLKLPEGTAQTDRNGEATCRVNHKDRFYDVLADHDQYANEWLGNIVVDSSRYLIELRKSVGVLVRITDEQGNLIQGSVARVLGGWQIPSETWIETRETDDHGLSTFDLAPGKHMFYGEASGYSTATSTHEVTKDVELVVDFSLVPAHVVQGVVVDELSAAPLAEASLKSQRYYVHYETETANDGTFSVPAEKSSLSYLVVKKHGYCDTRWPLPKDYDGERVTIKLKRATHLVGRLVDTGSRALAGAHIELVRGGFRRATRSDDDGVFRLEDICCSGEDRFFLGAWSPGRKLSAHILLRGRFAAPGAEPGRVIDIGDVTVDSTATLDGRVVDDTGKPVVGAMVSVFPSMITHYDPLDEGFLPVALNQRGENGKQRIVTDHEGRFRFEGLTTEDHWLRVEYGSDRLHQQVVQIGDSPSIEVQLDEQSAFVTIQITLLSQVDGTPCNQEVLLRPTVDSGFHLRTFMRGAKPDERGRVSFRDVPKTRYEVIAVGSRWHRCYTISDDDYSLVERGRDGRSRVQLQVHSPCD